MGAWLVGADSGQQIRISSTALPAGENVPSAIPGGPEPEDHGLLVEQAAELLKPVYRSIREDWCGQLFAS